MVSLGRLFFLFFVGYTLPVYSSPHEQEIELLEFPRPHSAKVSEEKGDDNDSLKCEAESRLMSFPEDLDRTVKSYISARDFVRMHSVSKSHNLSLGTGYVRIEGIAGRVDTILDELLLIISQDTTTESESADRTESYSNVNKIDDYLKWERSRLLKKSFSSRLLEVELLVKKIERFRDKAFESLYKQVQIWAKIEGRSESSVSIAWQDFFYLLSSKSFSGPHASDVLRKHARTAKGLRWLSILSHQSKTKKINSST